MVKKLKGEDDNENYYLNYEAAGPVASSFHEDDNFFRGLMGPIGSGKSVACCIEMFLKAQARPAGKDGIKRCRWVVVRNTQPQLESTTLKTWLDWFPEKIFGKVNRKSPITHVVRAGNLILELVFLALDRPEDLNKLLSLETTGVWLNEAKFIRKDILDAASGRTGRYPSIKDKPEGMTKEEWMPWRGIIADTNPPDDTHWWYKLAEEERHENYSFFKQPSGLSKEAENLHNLPLKYYDMQIAGKTKEYISVYLEGNYGFVSSGQPVYGKNWNDELHVAKEPIKLLPNVTVYIGVDFGLTPAAVFGQRTAQGTWNILDELVTPVDTTCTVPQFAEDLKLYINQKLSKNPIIVYGDPSGDFRDQSGTTAFTLFKSKGILVQKAPTNFLEPRKAAVMQPITRMIAGQPGFLLDKKCRMLRKGFNGMYRYKKVYASTDFRYSPEPEKNEYSHVHDALQYLMCGGGEYRDMTRINRGDKPKSGMQKPWKVM